MTRSKKDNPQPAMAEQLAGVAEQLASAGQRATEAGDTKSAETLAGIADTIAQADKAAAIAKPEPYATAPVAQEFRAVSRLTVIASEQAKRLADKMAALTDARQLLAEASDYFADASLADSEAKSVASRAGKCLYLASVQGGATPNEISAVLIDLFGAVPKKDGTPGKTPAGQGGTIRKRVVRMVGAYEFANSTDEQRAKSDIGGAFFNGLDPDEVAQVLAEVDNGSMPLFTAYDKLAELKPKAETLSPIFKPDAVLKMVDALSKEGTAAYVYDKSDLLAAYAALIGQLTFVTTEMVPVTD